MARRPGTTWTTLKNTPFGRVEVWSGDELVGVGELPLPLHRHHAMRTCLLVPLHWNKMKGKRSELEIPAIEFEVAWEPRPVEVAGERVPVGLLYLQAKNGVRF